MTKYSTNNGIPHYVVLDVRSRRLVYEGQSISEVAELLEPGMCHGQGATAEEAYAKAWAVATRCGRNEQERTQRNGQST